MLRKLLVPLAFVFVCESAAPAHATGKGSPQTHVVQKGQRLGSIAKRYNVTVDALAYANGLRQRDPIKPGQRLVIPERGDRDGSEARAAYLGTTADHDGLPTRRASLERTSGRRRSGPAWEDYARPPRRKNWVELSSHNSKWRGLVIDSKGKIRPSARTGISELLGATGDHPGAPDRLLRLLVEVSNAFGGRPLQIVSGYRTTSFFRDSRHKTSQAVDFAIVGVPNAVARDYLLGLENVGVGYYPNSSFLHLDVRPRSTHWVDYAGPGEAPRKTPHAPPVASPVDFDELAEQAAESVGNVERASDKSEDDSTPPREAAPPPADSSSVPRSP
jgi:LysM repeat protein